MTPSQFGKPFSEHSDLDLAIISAHLFGQLTSDFRLFSEDYMAGLVIPRSDNERALWEGNLEFGERNIPKGFYDAWKIPNFDRYSVTRRINQTMWKLVKKLEITEAAPRVCRASSRVFRDWPSFVNRITLNLSVAATTAQANVARDAR